MEYEAYASTAQVAQAIRASRIFRLLDEPAIWKADSVHKRGRLGIMRTSRMMDCTHCPSFNQAGLLTRILFRGRCAPGSATTVH
jgi:hypothetical protein